MAGCSLSLARAQSISDCEGAITLCGDLYTETDASFNSGAIQEFTGICNQNLEQSSVWYSFTVQEDGLLSFILDPLNPMDDYDWGLFDITTGGCEGIGTALLQSGGGMQLVWCCASRAQWRNRHFHDQWRNWELQWPG